MGRVRDRKRDSSWEVRIGDKAVYRRIFSKQLKEMTTRSGRACTGGGVSGGSGGGKGTKGLKDDKQPRIDEKYGRRVSFEDEREMASFKNAVTTELKKIRLEKTELGKLKVEIENKISEINEKVEGLEKRIVEIENKEKERLEFQNRMLSAEASGEGSVGESREGATGSQWSLFSERSKYSAVSVASKFSERDL